MRYLSVCSGIEAATVAWHDLGWTPAAFSEIEPFPSAVLAHHYPDVPNLGDMTKYKDWNLDQIDLLVGGTPCQSFSVAGLRKGLDDPRGNLMLTFLAIAERQRPRWIVWENVPGVLSSAGGRDFGTFLAALGQLGYGWAYRVLDAQWFGVAQRRRRVFVVGCLGDTSRAAKVLFERESVQRNPAPSREKRQDAAADAGSGIEGDSAVGFTHSGYSNQPAWITGNRTDCLSSGGHHDTSHQGIGVIVPNQATAYTPSSIGGYSEGVGTLRANGGDLGGGSETLIASPTTQYGDIAGSLTARHDSSPCADRGQNVLAMRESGQGFWMEDNVAGPLRAEGENRPSRPSHVVKQLTMQVRRLTPVECERLQGFPDNYTNIPWRKKDDSPDGPRYKALGNSMAVPVMRWIGQRIAQIEGGK